MNFVDIHTHLLPGVDDGAASTDEAVGMLKLAYEAGTRKIVATPHMFFEMFGNFDFVAIRDRFDVFVGELDEYREKLPFLNEMQVYLGAENYASPELFEALEQGCVLSLNGSRYLLVEVPILLPFSQIENVVARVFAAGYTPVLAHAERYGGVQEDPSRLVPFWERGGVVQVNGDSLLGGWGSKAQKSARKLLAEGIVDVIASDGHRLARRTPALDKALRWLESQFGEEDVQAWLSENPGALVGNELLQPAADHADLGADSRG